MKRIFYVLVLVVCTGFIILPALADTPQTLVSSHDAWKVYTFPDKAGKICFMESTPRKQEGKFSKRGPVFFFVTRWPEDSGKNAISVSNGYNFKPDSQAIMTIDGKAFRLFTREGMAWTKDQSEDDAVTAALQQGEFLVVRGTSARGTETTDTYSLKGSVAAYKAVTEECTKK